MEKSKEEIAHECYLRITGFANYDSMNDIPRATFESYIAIAMEAYHTQFTQQGEQKILEKIFNVGHNDDCMFCGFKDKIVVEALRESENKPDEQGEQIVYVPVERENVPVGWDGLGYLYAGNHSWLKPVKLSSLINNKK